MFSPVAEVSQHGVQLLGGVAIYIEDLDRSRRDTGEVERVRQDGMLGSKQFVRAWRDVEPDAAEALASQPGEDTHALGHVPATVGAE